MALLLAVLATAVAGCGGKDDSTSKTSAARGASGQQGTTGPQTGASGGTGTRDARPKQTGKSKHRPPKQRRAARGNTGSAAPATPAPPPSTTPSPSTTRGSSLTPEQLKEVKPQMYKQARFLCKASTLQGLAQQYGIKSGKADDVAKAYAAPYPVGLRKTVAAGCKVGLLESQ
jgi:hypothetical protein